MAHADIAGTMLITQYSNVKFKGKKPPEIPPQSLSCFDQTIPVPWTRQPGKHERIHIADKDLPYWSPSCEFRYKVGRKFPKDYTRKGDGVKILKGLCPPCSKLRKVQPLTAGAFKERDNPPNTLFRKCYQRGDLPLQVDHNHTRLQINWKVDVAKVDYHFFLPLFFDGVRETEDPYRFLAVKGCEDLLKAGEGKILPVVPQLIVPIKNALNTRDPIVIGVTLQLMIKLVQSEEMIGESLVPYYRQLLPILNIFRNNTLNIGDAIDYAQQKKTTLGDLVLATLEIFEKHGGDDAFINIKYMVPTYESAVIT
ncbi:hypothetical protein M758_10G036100 [Ceratodon purpureus]|uniref:Uncharacterized protein n=1 Tax=Ceratodon purpureus TaxID=3225 RepID=A0A8T0GNG8_CERPU|nr:hypothetical protein KC19_10G038900 [Ceratodon purpureus]KAG0602720.1 hypothetical protein M758_10G036100 [Ceratodon purpureus]